MHWAKWTIWVSVAWAYPRGWMSDGMLPWAEVVNTSEWDNNFYIEDGGNPISLANRFTTTPDSISLTTTYVDREPNLNYTDATIDIFFALDTDVCFLANFDWITLPYKDYQTSRPYINVWCSIYPVDAPRYQFTTQKSYLATNELQIHMAPRFCPGYTGRVRLSVSHDLNPRDGYYGYGSGSSFRLSNIRMVAGKCVDQQNELIVGLSVMGVFLAIFIGLGVGLRFVQRKFPGGKPFVVLAAWWHLFKLASLSVFIWSMYQRNFSVSYALSLCFLARALIVQMVSACVLMSTELRRSDFSVWYYRHRIVCNTIGFPLFNPLLET